MAMTPEQMRIDDRQLDDALRTLATAPAPDDLPVQVLSAIAAEAHGWWQPLWRPAIGVALGVTVVALIAVWMQAPTKPRATEDPRVLAHGTAPAHPASARTPPREAQGAGRSAQRSEAASVRTIAPRRAHGSGLMAQGGPPVTQGSVPMAQGDEDGVPALEPLAPLTIAQLQTPQLSERQLQLTALDVPALEIEMLER